MKIRLNENQKNEIYELHIKNERTPNIAKLYNTTSSTINRVIKKFNDNLKVENRHRAPRKPMNELMGSFFGQLEVIEMIEPKKRNPWLYRCKCHSCGNENFIRSSKGLKNRINPTCGCVNWNRKKGNESPFYKGYGEISGSFWNIVKKNAKQRKIDFEITIDYAWDLFLEQNRKCSLSGEEISFGKSNYDETTSSLDRIDSSKGYVKGNVQWVHKSINFMKHDLSEEKFLYYCKKIIEWKKN